MPSSPFPPDHDASPRLTWAEDGSPRSGRFGDVYFSVDDGLAETRAVFLAGCALPEAWAGRSRFTVAELGFGSGLNIVALLDLWRRERPAGGRLHIFTIEAYPLDRDEAARALTAWPEVAEAAEALLAAWPPGTPGFHRIDLPGFDTVVDLAIGEVGWALDQWSGRADAWFLDGFSPALNPGMWSPEVLERVAARSASGARLATFTVAGAVRRGLAEHGFQVEKRPGHGRKRERLEARLEIGAPAETTARRVAVIGAGIAGAATARALEAGGAEVVIFDGEEIGSMASGFPAALVTPRLDAGDVEIAAFHAQALERARDLYLAIPGAVVSEGVLQLEQTSRDADRFARIAGQPWWQTDAMAVVEADAATGRLGEPISTGGLSMAQALAVRPAAILSAWLDGMEVRRTTVAEIMETAGGWRLLDTTGTVLAEVDAVVVGGGWGTAALAPELNLRPVRGQANWVEGVTGPAVAWGGYAAPMGSGMLFGATHDRDDTDAATRPADSERNLATLKSRLPERGAAVEGREVWSRAAIRATTRDRLPACGAMAGREGLFVLSGLGSRGFCVAPLLGEHVAALITGAPSPLPSAFAARLSPDRLG